MAAANRTPLRRVSQGSLSALARFQPNHKEGSTGLEFLAPAMSELAEEMEMIATNLDSLNEISDSLDSFNEAFASYLYVMKMNTLCVEWPEAPTATSFLHRIEELEREFSNRSSSSARQPSIVASFSSNMAQVRASDVSYAIPSAPPPNSPTPPPVSALKPAGSSGPAAKSQKTVPSGKAKKPQMTAKEKKARSIWIEKLINLSPVDFRGNNPSLRKAAEEVLNGLMDANNAVRPADLVKPNILPPVMVNKCLIAFVAAKIVQRDNVNGVALYQLSELAHKDRSQ